METLIIPETIILDSLEKGLQFVRTDYQTNLDANAEQDSYLYRILHGIGIERYTYFTQGKKVFLAEEDDPRKLNIDLMYNMNVDKVPSVYIALANEQNGQNGMGLDQGYQQDLENEDGSTLPVFTRRKNTSYNIMITSDNSNEVVMIYHFLYALLTSLIPHLNIKGLENISIGGQDLQLRGDLIPKNIFMRALAINLQYETSVPDLSRNPTAGAIFFSGTPVEEVIPTTTTTTTIIQRESTIVEINEIKIVILSD